MRGTMDAKTILTLTVRPTLALMGARYQGQAAERLLVAISMQESGLRARTQLGGPARGLWQFEKAGVAGVLTLAGSLKAPAYAAAAVLARNTHVGTTVSIGECFAGALLWGALAACA